MNFYGGRPGLDFRIEYVVESLQELQTAPFGCFVLLSNPLGDITKTTGNIKINNKEEIYRDWQNTLWRLGKNVDSSIKYEYIANLGLNNVIIQGRNAPNAI